MPLAITEFEVGDHRLIVQFAVHSFDLSASGMGQSPAILFKDKTAKLSGSTESAVHKCSLRDRIHFTAIDVVIASASSFG